MRWSWVKVLIWRWVGGAMVLGKGFNMEVGGWCDGPG